MKIVIIGSGNVAYHLAKELAAKQLGLIQLFGRNEIALQGISSEINVPFSTMQLMPADLYLIAVSDAAVEDVSAMIKDPNAVVAHTSGSLPTSVLKGDYKKASFYPLQTFSRNKALDFKNIPIFIEAEDQLVETQLKKIAQDLSNHVEISTYEKRKYIHLTAVFACNFVNHLFARAQEISDAQEIPFHYFLPLIEETFDKLKFLDPRSAQTGPAVRDDQRVMDLHRALITNEEQLRIYNTMNESIKKMYNL